MFTLLTPAQGKSVLKLWHQQYKEHDKAKTPSSTEPAGLLTPLTVTTGPRCVTRTRRVDQRSLIPQSSGSLAGATGRLRPTPGCVTFQPLEKPWTPHLTYPSVRT